MSGAWIPASRTSALNRHADGVGGPRVRAHLRQLDRDVERRGGELHVPADHHRDRALGPERLEDREVGHQAVDREAGQHLGVQIGESDRHPGGLQLPSGAEIDRDCLQAEAFQHARRRAHVIGQVRREVVTAGEIDQVLQPAERDALEHPD
jgi:hypothetical protein